MSDPESEDEIIDRIEDALRRIASVVAQPGAAPAPGDAQVAPPLDREALAATLDTVIARLRGGLAPSRSTETE